MERGFQFTDHEEMMLIEQIKYLQAELCSIQSSFLGVISIPVAVYGLLIYYGLQLDNSGNANILFIIMPFLFSLSLFNILKYTIKMMGLDAYISYLEQQLNLNHGKSLFKWQSNLIYANSYSVVGGVIQIPSFLALTIFLGYKFYINVRLSEMFPHSQFILVALLTCQIIGLAYMLLICLTQYGTVRYWCNTITTSYLSSDEFHSECPLFLLSFFEKSQNRSWFKKLNKLIDKFLNIKI